MVDRGDKTIADLFNEEPFQWGLRGDPGLWKAMREYFANTALPETVEELRTLIEQAFLKLTGKPWTGQKDFYLEKFDRGGMSAGMISMDFWQEDALPLLMKSFEQGRKKD